MDFFDDMSSVKYGDYKGMIQIDGHDGVLLHDLCRNNNIDLQKYFPIAFQIFDSSLNGINPGNDFSLTVYAVEKAIAGKNFDDISSYIRANNGQVTVSEHEVHLPFSELPKYIKRYSIFAVQNDLDSVINEFFIEGDDE